jgi:hypothetical protein
MFGVLVQGHQYFHKIYDLNFAFIAMVIDAAGAIISSAAVSMHSTAYSAITELDQIDS